MRIELADILDESFPATDVDHVSDTIIRFRLAKPLPVSPYYAFLSAGAGNISALMPEAPNRSAVAELLQHVRTALADALKRERDCPLLRKARVETERDFARLNIDHFSTPDWLYSNGQGIVSVIERDSAIEVVPHAAPISSLEQYLRFGSQFEPAKPLNAAMAARFSTLTAAESWIARWLGRPAVSCITTAKDGVKGVAFLQEFGARRGERGYPIRTFLIHHAGTVERAHVGPQESYAFLNQLNFGGFRARTCATCAHFSFSGMSFDMSNGQSGYCAKRQSDSEATMPVDALTGVFDSCEQHVFIEDSAREHPYALR